MLVGLVSALVSAAEARPATYSSVMPARIGGLSVPARVQARGLALARGNSFRTQFWAGINLGSTVPGTQPGELAVSRAVYDRWLADMGRLGIRVIRVYTIQRPGFYDALASYNGRHPDAPLLLIQGVWIPEQQFVASGNAYAPAVTNGFRSEIRDAVAVVHGNANLPLRHGHAGGRYRSNVSRWLLAWSLGIEWDQFAVASTDRMNRGRHPYRGQYVRSQRGSTPMESWVASMLDWCAALEAKRGWSRPLTFTNWVTADPLQHAYEPLPKEDMVSIDATHLAATKRWPGGFFASYHVYPYYPDFLRRTPAYQLYRRPWDGKLDPYAGYLHALRAYHGKQVVMVTEFGVPTSLGLAHRGPLGRGQGAHSEREAARMDAQMLDDIRREGYAGGMLFEWVDEWFKLTWNTVEYERPPGRRQLWRDPLNNEAYFGVIAADPGSSRVVTLDGNDNEWTRNGSQVIAASRGPVREARAVKDEGYLYLRLRLEKRESWRTQPITIGFDAYRGGNRGLPGTRGFDPRAETSITIGPGGARLRKAAWIDPLLFQYGFLRHFLPVRPADLRLGSGVWVEPRQILNRPLTVPRSRRRIPVELQSYGTLQWGTTDPRSPGFDDRHLVDGSGKVLELRIPFSFLGFSDPSSLQVLVPNRDGSMSTQTVHGNRMGICIAAGPKHLVTRGYGWDPWNRVLWHERRKAGWPILRAAFARAAR